MARGGARPGAGRKPGPSRRTREQIEAQRIQEQANAALIEAAKPPAHRKRMAIDVLEDFMHIFAGMAAFHQPAPPQDEPNPNEDEERFLMFAARALEFATPLARYQSPSFRAIAVAPVLPVATPEPTASEDGGNVIEINDPERLQRVYHRLLRRAGGRP